MKSDLECLHGSISDTLSDVYLLWETIKDIESGFLVCTFCYDIISLCETIRSYVEMIEKSVQEILREKGAS